MEKNFTVIQRIAYAMMIIIMSYLILTQAKQILYPLVLAMLFSYILLPLVIFFERRFHFPQVLAIIFSVLLGVFLFAIVIYLFSLQIKIFVKDLPALKAQLNQNLTDIGIFIQNKFHLSIDDQKAFIKSQTEDMFDLNDEKMKVIAKSASKTIEGIVFIPIFTFFILLLRKRWRKFILQIASSRDNKVTVTILEQISQVTIHYVAGVFTVVVILAVCHSIALTLIGIQYPIAIAIMTATISILPYFGTLVSGLLPITFSLLFSSNPISVIFIIAYFLFITFIDHNILTPTITGGNVNLNPLATILGLVLAAWIWGIPGMIVVVPLLAVVKIICDNIEGLQPYGYLLGMDLHGINISKLLKFLKKKKSA